MPHDLKEMRKLAGITEAPEADTQAANNAAKLLVKEAESLTEKTAKGQAWEEVALHVFHAAESLAAVADNYGIKDVADAFGSVRGIIRKQWRGQKTPAKWD